MDINKLWLQSHVVPVSELVTIDTLSFLALSLWWATAQGYTWVGFIITILIFLFLDVIFHPLVNTPNNLSYFFGMGEKPPGWRYD